MNHNITLLTELRDKYIKALELMDFNYCFEHRLLCGLCLPMLKIDDTLYLSALLTTLRVDLGLITKSLQ